MDKAEFMQWLDHHCKLFDGVKAFANKGTMEAWQRVLEPVSLDAAKAASDRLYEAEKRPRMVSDHAAAVKRIAGQAQRDQVRRYQPTGTSDCRFWCTDDGMVFLRDYRPETVAYHLRQVKRWLEDRSDEGQLWGLTKDHVGFWGEREWAEFIGKRFPAAVACSCPKGEQRAALGMYRFKPERDLPLLLQPEAERPEHAPHWTNQHDLAGDDAA